MNTYSLSPVVFLLVTGNWGVGCASAGSNDSGSLQSEGCALALGSDCEKGGGSSTGGKMTGDASSGGVGTTGGASASGGATASGGVSATGGNVGEPDLAACDATSLVWKTGKKTNYTSYPEPGSEECVVYNGCEWAGWFAGCEEQQTPEWVASHNIVALFPGFNDYQQHDICIRSGDKTMIVTVYDTCGDSDCDGCCTANKGNADALLDLESATNQRWGLPDGQLLWADLGLSKSLGCD